MKAYIEERVLGIAAYLLETGATVRAAAGKFKISKSTVHKDVTERLVELNPSLAKQVRRVLQKNMEERHIRGGEATRQRYCRQSGGRGKPAAGCLQEEGRKIKRRR